MADLNHIRTQLLNIMRPKEGGPAADLIGLFEEWNAWVGDAEVNLVADTLEESAEPRFLRLLIQYLSQIPTTRALARLHRLAQHLSPAISNEALRALEKIGSLSAQRLLLDWALHDPHQRREALASLLRCATPDLLEELQLALLTAPPDEVTLAILSLFKKLRTIRAITSILDILKRTGDERLQSQAIFSIAHLGQSKHLRHVLPFLKSPHAPVRRAVFFAISRLGGAKRLDLLVKHLSLEEKASVRLDILRDMRSCPEPTRRAFENLAQFAASTSEPGERYLASELLAPWAHQKRGILRKAFFDRALKTYPPLAVILLHLPAFTKHLPAARLGDLARTHADPAIRAAALETLSLALSQLAGALRKEDSLEDFLRDGSADVRRIAARLIARFAPKEALDGIWKYIQDPIAWQSFIFTLTQQNRAQDLTPFLHSELLRLAETGNRTMRTLVIRLLAQSNDPKGAQACQAISLAEKDPRLAMEAVWGVLRYAGRHPSAFQDLFTPLLNHRRACLHLIRQVSRLAETAPKTRKALALRIGVFITTRPFLLGSRLSEEARGWLLLWRAMTRDLEHDVLDWFSIGALTSQNSAPLIRVLRSLLKNKTIRMDFAWLSAQMEHPSRPIREQAAHLIAHHFPWTPDQTRHLVRWRLGEQEASLRSIVDAHLRHEALGFVEERRTVTRT